MGELAPALPQEDNNTENRYNLRSDRNHNYNYRYAGKDFVIDSVTMTTHRTGEVLETP